MATVTADLVMLALPAGRIRRSVHATRAAIVHHHSTERLAPSSPHLLLTIISRCQLSTDTLRITNAAMNDVATLDVACVCNNTTMLRAVVTANPSTHAVHVVVYDQDNTCLRETDTVFNLNDFYTFVMGGK